jgi:hypothetical protein
MTKIRMLKFIKTVRESIKFFKNESAWNGLTIYSEGGSYAPYIRPIIDELGASNDGDIYYLTSDETDPLYLDPPSHVTPYFIGMGSMRTYVLNNMRAKVLAMTMPDLETFHIKRSTNVQHYNYFHHSLVSTHMVYRTGAFDHFDSIMCVGPYHANEIRGWEEIKDLPAKQIFKHGSPPLDKLVQLSSEPIEKITPNKNAPAKILVAPSWGQEGLLETCGKELIALLLDAGYSVHLRPHPRTRQLTPNVVIEIRETFNSNSNFTINEDISGHDALLQSDAMICDWSGVAMEFAFGLSRPVIFVDVPRKVQNPEYTMITTEPLEVSYRQKVGAVIALKDLNNLPEKLNELVKNSHNFKMQIEKLRNELFYNIGSSSRHGAEILLDIKASLKSRRYDI